MARAALVLLLLASACRSTGPSSLVRVPIGTWGGDEAGLIVAENEAHAHIGCTLGDIVGPIPVNARGGFDVLGTYNVDAFPVDRGIRHPARFIGQTNGLTLTLLVQLTDDGRAFGPVMLSRGVTPRMKNCPICSR
jgi:hypothetical protein